MPVKTRTFFLTTTGVITALLYACALALGQSTAGNTAARTMVPVPFVGCPSFGQFEVLEAPKGIREPVPISERDAQALAYYKSADGIGVLAPRGWYCQEVSGSGGAALYLGPSPIIHSSSGWEGLGRAAIVVSDISSANSGRYDIAELIARAFPAYRSFARRIWNLDSPFPSGPYPKDTLTYRGSTVVEYRTAGPNGRSGKLSLMAGERRPPDNWGCDSHYRFNSPS